MDSSPLPRQWLSLVPNGLSCLRLGIAGVFYWLGSTERIVAACAAAASDFLDGVIARRYGLTSVVGGLLDALGDKLFVLIALLTLCIEEVIAWWQLPLVLIRDLCVGGTVVYAVTTRTWGAFRHMPAHPLGKQATAVQFALILGALIAAEWARWLVIPAILLSGLAAAIYLARFVQLLREPPER